MIQSYAVQIFQKAKSLLHWNPKIELNQGLNPTIEWFRKAINE